MGLIIWWCGRGPIMVYHLMCLGNIDGYISNGRLLMVIIFQGVWLVWGILYTGIIPVGYRLYDGYILL